MLACDNSIYCANAVKLCALYYYSDDMAQRCRYAQIGALRKSVVLLAPLITQIHTERIWKKKNF